MIYYCFKMKTLQGIEEKEYKTLEEAKKWYDEAVSGLWGINKGVYELSSIYTKRK